MTLGEKIKARRKELGFTLEALARKMRVANKSTVQRWESGYIKKISYADIKLLAEALEVPVSYFDVELCSPQIEEQPKGTIMTAGDRVKKLRTEKGMTQGELAEKLGYRSKTSIAHIENGRDLPRSMLVNLADYFNCSIDYLLGRTDDPVPAAEDNSPKRLKAAVRRLHPKKPGPKKKKQAPLRRSRKAILERLKSYRPGKPEVRKEEKNMKEDMSKYIHDLGFALMSYSRNGVYRIRYICENDSEYAEISFTDGTKKRVNITGDSCLAAMLDITKALI